MNDEVMDTVVTGRDRCDARADWAVSTGAVVEMQEIGRWTAGRILILDERLGAFQKGQPPFPRSQSSRLNVAPWVRLIVPNFGLPV